MSTRWLLPGIVVVLVGLLLAGCALDPIEEQQEKLDSQKVIERRAAVTFLKDYEDDRTVELLVETLESDPELLEEAGNALVLKGRQWEEEHPNAKKSEQNPVIEQLSQTIGDMHLEAPVRTKACWVLGEIGSRRAIGALRGRTADPSSMKVRDEATTSLKKLGAVGDAAPREMLADGQFVEDYDEEARGKRGLMFPEDEEKAAEEEAEAAPLTKQPTKADAT
jgi:HEAT repeat protein